ncbi:hypothetical protein BH24PSE2_BH24PSE2_12990 [soil metagenome]
MKYQTAVNDFDMGSRGPARRKLFAGLAGAAIALASGAAFGVGFDLSADMERSNSVIARDAAGQPLDFNCDGIVDLVIGNVALATSAPSRVYLGNGDGTFTEASTLSTVTATSVVAAGDLDGDGNLDIVESSRSTENLYYAGNGDGTFAAGQPIGPEIEASASIELADMDGDGALDAVIANADNAQVNRVYPNTSILGVISFGAPVDITADTDFSRDVAVADLDADGDLDVVAGNDDRAIGGASGNTPSKVYLNQLVESGTFSFAAGVALAQSQDSVDDIELGDLDADGDVDLIYTSFSSETRVYLNQLMETGAFAFDAGANVANDGADHGNGGELADIDGDGDLDVLVANGKTTAPTAGEINQIYLNQFVETGTVSFTGGQSISDDADITRDVAASDLDGDGDLDVVAASRETSKNRVYLSNGTATPFTNVVPEFTSTPDTTATIDEVYTYNITTNDPDPEDTGDTLSIDAPDIPAWLSLTDNADGTATLTGTPTAADIGGDNDVTLIVTDDEGLTGDQMFTISVTEEANEAPVFDSSPITTATIDVEYTYNVTVSDTEGDPITISAPTLPAWLTLTDNGDGTATLSGTPAVTDIGDHDVVLEATDGNATTQQPFTITVGAVPPANTAPEFTSTAVTDATVDEAYSYDITTSDADGDPLTITAPTLPAWLTFTDNGDGTAALSGTPGAGDEGDHAVSLEVSDGTDTATQDFTITVAAAAAPPPPAPPPAQPPVVAPRRDGGGGALGLWSFLAMIAMIGATRRRRRI